MLPAGPSVAFQRAYRSLLVATILSENVQLISVLINSPTKIMQNTIYLYEYFIVVPHITELSTVLLDLIHNMGCQTLGSNC